MWGSESGQKKQINVGLWGVLGVRYKTHINRRNFVFLILFRGLLLCAVLACVSAFNSVSAQNLVYQSSTPAPHAIDVALNTNITVSFDDDLDAATISEANIVIWAERQGILAQPGILKGVFSGGGAGNQTFTFDPTDDLLPGDRVHVIITTGLQNLSAESVASPYSFDFEVTNSGSSPAFNTTLVDNITDQIESAEIADIDGDGNMDVLITSYNDDDIIWFRGNGDGTFSGRLFIDTSENEAHDAAPADIDGDGDLDVFVAYDDGVLWFENVGSGTTSFVNGANRTQIVTLTNADVRAVEPADVDGDGDIDVIIAASSGDDINWYENTDGTGTFVLGQQITSGDANDLNGAYDVIASDFDNDGDTDLVSISNVGNDLVWWENDGSGIFSLGSTGNDIDVDLDGGRKLAVGDVDNDGDVDLIGTARDDDDIIVFINNFVGSGSVTFSADEFVNNDIDQPEGVRLGDIDGDGDLDILVAARGTTSSRAAFNGFFWYANNGSGNFNATPNIIQENVLNANSLAIGDLNNDGRLDVVTVAGSGSLGEFYTHLNVVELSISAIQQGNESGPTDVVFRVSVSSPPLSDLEIDLTDNGTGTATSGDDYVALPASVTIVAGNSSADVNVSVIDNDATGESFLETIDVSVSNPSLPGFVALDQSSATGVIQDNTAPFTINSTTPASSALGVALSSNIVVNFSDNITVGSATTDNFIVYSDRREIIPGVLSGGGTSSLTFDPNGSGFLPGERISVLITPNLIGQSASGLSLGHFFTFTAAVETGGANPSFSSGTEVSSVSSSGDFESVEAVDIDGDGDLDLLVTSFISDDIIWFENTSGDGSTWAQNFIDSSENEAFDATAGDIDGDGDLDVLVAYDDGVLWYANVGGAFVNGSNRTEIVSLTNLNVKGVELVDADADGDLDAFVASGDNDAVIFYKNDGSGTFTESQVLISGSTFDDAYDVKAADLDNDGDFDIVAASENDDDIVWFENTDGQGTFSAAVIIDPFLDAVREIALGDLDGDGDIDVVGSARNTDEIGIYLSNFASTDAVTFGETEVFSGLLNEAEGIRLGDLDADGDLDIIVALRGDADLTVPRFGDGIYWLENDGLANFSGPNELVTGLDQANALALGDFNGDGTLDVVAGSAGNSDDVFLYLNLNEVRISETVRGNEAGTVGLEFTIALNFTNNTGGNIDVEVTDLLTGTATSGVDYTDFTAAFGSNPATVSIPDGQSSVTLTVPVLDNADAGEGFLETVDVSIALVSSIDGYQVLDEGTASGEIEDDDPRVSFVSSTPADGEKSFDRTANLTFTFDAPITTATATADNFIIYGSQSGLINGVFSGGNTATITFDPASDLIPGEQVSVTITPDIRSTTATAPASDEYVLFNFIASTDAIPGAAFGSANDVPDNNAFERFNAVTTGDIDGDGDVDIVSATQSGGVAWYRNTDGIGTFEDAGQPASSSGTGNFVRLGDIDNDGDLDIIKMESRNLVWHENTDGAGTFSAENVIENTITSGVSKGVSLGDVDGDGDLDIVASLTSHSQGFSVALYINVNGDGSSWSQVAIDATSNINKGVIFLDADLDGDLDIVTSEVSWYQNTDGAGTFDSEVIILDNVGSSLSNEFITAGDVDGDGIVEVVVPDASRVNYVNFSLDPVTKALTGSPEEVQINPTNLGDPRPVIVDLDGDGDLDMAVAARTGNQVITFLNDGTGSFTQEEIVSDGEFVTLTQIAAGDFDGDGDPDLVVTNTSSSSQNWYENVIPISLGVTREGNEEGPVSIELTATIPVVNTTGAAVTVNLADLGTGSADLTDYSLDGGTISIANGASSGTQTITVVNDGDLELLETIDLQINTSSNSAFDVDPEASGVVATIIDNETPLSVLTISPSANDPGVTLNNNIDIVFSESIDGATLNSSNIVVFGSQSGVLTGTFSGGGTTSVSFDPANDFTAGEKITVTLTSGLLAISGNFLTSTFTYEFIAAGSGSGIFLTPQEVVSSFAATRVYQVDLDGDQDLDLLAASSSEIAWYENTDGHGTLGAQNLVTNASFTIADLYPADIDGDGNPDIVVLSSVDDDLSWFENTGGSFGAENFIDANTTALRFFVADMDGDGDLDAVAGESGDGVLYWYENTDGLGTFTTKQAIISTSDVGGPVTVGDVNGDRLPDIISGGFNTNFALGWYENQGLLNGALSYASPTAISTDNNAAQAELIDLDSDGDLDLLAITQFQDLEWYENIDGNGTFAAASAIDNVSAFATGDYNGDGRIDIAAFIESENRFVIFENQGFAVGGLLSFVKNGIVSDSDTELDLVAFNSGGISAGDFDGDNDIDFVVTESDDFIYFLENAIPIVVTVTTNGNEEGSESIDLTATVAVTNNTGSTISLNVGNGGGTATEISDYGTLAGLTLDIADGQSTGSVSIPVVDDADLEGQETVIFSLTNPGVDDLLDVAPETRTATAVIADNETFLQVTSTSPAQHAISASLSGNLTVTFSEDIDATSVNSTNVIVRSARQGNLSGSLSVATNQITFNPDNDFIEGDEISLLVNTGILSTPGTNALPLEFPYIFTFRTATGVNATPDFSERVIIDASVSSVSSVLGIVPADLDQDGDIDLIVASGNLFWYENLDGTGTFGARETISFSSVSADQVTVADIDNDGDLDIVTDDEWFENNGIEVFSIGETFNGSSHDYTIPVDFDYDGDLDVIAQEGTGFGWIENTDGLGDFGNFQLLIGQIDPGTEIILGDLDNDGDLDMVDPGTTSGTPFSWYETAFDPVSGQFSVTRRTDIINSEFGASEVQIGDMDGDGDADLVFVNALQDRVYLLRNMFSGSGEVAFSAAEEISDDTGGATWLQLLDMDGDADLDVLVAGAGDNDISWFENDGTGGLGDEKLIDEDLSDLSTVAFGDIDGDGDMDLISHSETDDDLVWYRGGESVSLAVTANGDESGPVNIQFTLTLESTNTSGATITVDIDDTGSGTATSSSDYVPFPSLQFEILNGTNSDVVEVTVEDDALVEFSETLEAVISNISNNQYVINSGRNTAVASIADNEARFVMVNSSPSPHEIGVIADTNITLTFNDDVDAATINSGAVTLFSNRFGIIGGTVSAVGGDAKSIVFDPTDDLKPGELYTVVVNNTLSGQTLGALFNPAIVNFRTVSLRPDFNNYFEHNSGIAGDQVFSNIPGEADPDFGVISAESVRLVDFDLDGDLDLIAPLASISSGPNQWIFFNDGSGNFSQSDLFSRSGVQFSSFVDVGDIDGDGDLDVQTYSSENEQLYWFENEGTLPLTTRHTIATIFANSSANDFEGRLIDIDSDGDVDVVGYRDDDGDDELILYLNDGSESFSPLSITTDLLDHGFGMADVDGDFDFDFIVVNSNTELVWLENNGALSFQERLISSVGDFSGTRIITDDINSDGLQDVLAFYNSGNVLSIFTNGAGQVFSETQVRAGTVSSGFVYETGDFDNDGAVDIFLFDDQNSINSYMLLRNDGSENFTEINFGTTDAANDVVLTDAVDFSSGDLDGDGVYDLVSVSTGNGEDFNVSFWLEGNIGGASIQTIQHGNEEGPVDIVYRVSLNAVNGSGSDVIIDIADNGTGTATSASDYNAFNSVATTVTIPNGGDFADFTLPVVDDTVSPEETETAVALIHGTSDARVVIIDDRDIASANIIDNDNNLTGHTQVLWLRADLGTSTTNDGNTLSAWEDQSAAGNDATQILGGTVQYILNASDHTNFNPLVRFAASGYYELADPSLLPGGGNTRTYFLVGKSDDTAANDRTFFSHGSAGVAESVNLTLNGNTLETAIAVNGLTRGVSGGAAPDVEIGTYTFTSSSTSDALFAIDGSERPSSVLSGSDQILTTGGDVANVGASFTDSPLDGDLQEVIVYDAALSALERQQVETYLAIKHGITLTNDNNGNALTFEESNNDGINEGDYVTSQQIVVWDATINSLHHNNVAGIGLDELFNLNQKQSKSIRPGAIVAIGLDDDNDGLEITNLSNTSSFSADGDYLVWGHDNGATSGSVTELDINLADRRLVREWKVQETGTVGMVSLQFDVSGLLGAGSLNTGENNLVLLVDDDGDFSNGSELVAQSFLTADDNLANFSVDFTDGQFFTLAVLENGPGGAGEDVFLWLRADLGVLPNATNGSTVNLWEDHGPLGNDASRLGVDPVVLDNNTDNINFNPLIRFNGNDGFSLDATLLPFSGSSRTYFVVGNGNSGNNSQFSHGNAGSGDGIALSNNDGVRLSVDANGSEYGVATAASVTEIATFHFDGANLSDFSFNNNGQRLSASQLEGADVTINTGVENAYVGLDISASSYLSGDLSEVIVFGSALSATEWQQVESYLAIKYGITLTNDNDADGFLFEDSLDNVDGIEEGDYTARGGLIFWDASQNSVYHHDVSGIGRHDKSLLNQKQSKSINSDAVVAIGLDGDVNGLEGTNSANNSSFSTDNSYLVWGNDNAPFDDGGSTEFDPQRVQSRITREWFVQETGNLGTVTLQFDVSGLLDANDLNALEEDVVLLVDNNGDFSDGGTTIISQSYITASDNLVNFSHDFSDGQFFTLAATLCGPGGVFNDLVLWLRADIGTAATTEGASTGTWDDQSGSGNHATVTNGTPAYTLTSSNTNFNPFIRLDGDDSYSLMNPSLLPAGGSDRTYFVVGQTADQTTDGAVFLNHGSTVSAGQRVGLTLNGDNHEVAVDYNGVVNGFAGSPSGTVAIGAYTLATGNSAGTSVFLNGATRLQTELSGANLSINTGSAYGVIGTDGSESDFLNGNIQEIVAFGAALTAENRQRVESYLALKYGITLTNDSDADGNPFESSQDNADGISEGNYVISDQTAVWDVTMMSATHNNVAGIGRDDLSCFEQKMSKSVNSDAIVTIGLDDTQIPDGLENTNLDNDGTFETDLSFLIWGHDGSALNAPNEEFDPVQVNSRLNREWRVQETGTIGTVVVQFDISSIAGPPDGLTGTNDESQVVLLVDNDGDFRNGAVVVAQSFVTPGDNLVNFQVNFSSGQYFTLGSSEESALPISLLWFESYTHEDHIRLKWATAKEVNNSHFLIERSENGLDFTEVGSVPGNLDSDAILEYGWSDYSPLSGANYYRLVDVDVNGIKNFSSVLRENYIGEFISTAYPNPVTNGQNLYMRLPTSKEPSQGEVEAQFFTSTGIRLVPSVTQKDGLLTISTTGIKEGVYLLHVLYDRFEVRHKIIITR